MVLLACQPSQQKETITSPSEPSLTFAWQSLTSPTTASLRGLAVVSEDIAWVSGSLATVIKTTDGGQSWLQFTFDVPDSLQFRDIEAYGRDTAYVLSAGSPGLIFKTTDGGQSWRKQYENNAPGIFLDGMAFWDSQRGVVMGDPLEGSFMILRTEDGGENWQRVAAKNLPVPAEGEAGFAASGTNIIAKGRSFVGFACGGKQSRFIYSEDGSQSWNAVKLPLVQGEASQGAFSLAFADTLRGVAVGGDFLQADDTTQTAAFTQDGGKTWRLAEKMPGGYRSGAAYVPTSEMFIATGTNGTDYSLDFGRTWQAVDTVGYHAVQAVPGKRMAWLSGNDGKVAKLSW